ncbi:MAG: hypothetical protein M1825_006393 [Sarcosagium campestre]|nr:MAG: hypothetical protein M1825_006393 [Sarcosagium campestre]
MSMSSLSPASSTSDVSAPPPPPPPRAGTVHLTPYSIPISPHSSSSTTQQHTSQRQWMSRDPRSSSLQSLLPVESASHAGKRTLLLVFIHGFLGDESSFRSFPAHLHNLLTVTLGETHVVHTKIYPRYKSRRPIEFARDDFSKWLAPHESPTTDVVLLGHSMGGILSAEVVLLPQEGPYATSPGARRHRVLGTVNFDTPFLGMHPGVIVSGLGSLFRPAEPPKDAMLAGFNDASSLSVNNAVDQAPLQTLNSQSSSSGPGGYFDSTPSLQSLTTATSVTTATHESDSPFLSPSASDPNFDPPFPNDVRRPVRTGWNNMLHFVVKHSDGLTKATKQYVTSHLEFGGCLADYPGLKNRYTRLRALESLEEDISIQPDGSGAPATAQSDSIHSSRVRFVNYYTASTGRPKKARTPSPQEGSGRSSPQSLPVLEPPGRRSHENPRSRSRSPRISIDETRDGETVTRIIHESSSPPGDEDGRPAVTTAVEHVLPIRISDSESPDPATAHSRIPPNTNLTPLGETEMEETAGAEPHDPTLPSVPPHPQPPMPPVVPSTATKEERKGLEKAHAQAQKEYRRSVKAHDKAIAAREKVEAKRAKAAAKIAASSQPQSQPQARRDRKFCVLPSGGRDPTWVRVFMEGVDEVGAHCGLFFVSEAYEMLVGDVGGRIEEWVKEEESAREVRRILYEG